MSRIARAVLEDVPHHITQRGNGRQVIFDTVEGRLLYLDLLRDSAKRFGLSIWAYCLMSNHIHLLAAPKRADSLARALGRIHAGLCALPKYVPPQLRARMAGAVLFLPAGGPAFVEGDGVYRTQSSPGRALRSGEGLPMVQCEGAC